MIELDHEIFSAVVEQAKHAAQGDARWCAAIDRAAKHLADNPYVHTDGRALLVLSPQSANIYRANGSCQCRAFEFGRPCWHRAANRLIERYYEAVAHRYGFRVKVKHAREDSTHAH